MHLMILAYNIFFLLGLPILYFGLKPMVISTEVKSHVKNHSNCSPSGAVHETTRSLRKTWDLGHFQERSWHSNADSGHENNIQYRKHQLITAFALFQVPYMIIIFSLCLHIFYNLLFKDHKMTKLHRRFARRKTDLELSILDINCALSSLFRYKYQKLAFPFRNHTFQLSFSFLTLALPFMVGCLGIFRSVATNKPVQSYFRSWYIGENCVGGVVSHDEHMMSRLSLDTKTRLRQLFIVSTKC